MWDGIPPKYRSNMWDELCLDWSSKGFPKQFYPKSQLKLKPLPYNARQSKGKGLQMNKGKGKGGKYQPVAPKEQQPKEQQAIPRVSQGAPRTSQVAGRNSKGTITGRASWVPKQNTAPLV